MPKPHPLTLLGTTIALTACTSVPPSQQSFTPQQKAVASPHPTPKHRAIKRYNDGSTPFTMQEIEERLLKVFALPPDQVNKATIEQAFGVELLETKYPSFHEKISEEEPMIFSILGPNSSSINSVFRYQMYKKGEKDGEIRHFSEPKDIPDAYKIPYLPFVKKLEERGWKFHGRDYSYGFFYHFFQKSDGYSMRVWIDTLKRRGDEFDHSDSKISSIVIETIPTYNK